VVSVFLFFAYLFETRVERKTKKRLIHDCIDAIFFPINFTLNIIVNYNRQNHIRVWLICVQT
jgi:hypothetical protein